jgi:GNAT superfamily N-acetyltransferase
VCDRIEPVAHGVAVRATAIGDLWDYNLLRVPGPTDASAETLAAAADVALAGLDHRLVDHLEVIDEATGARLEPGFRALGWEVWRNEWMLHDPGVAVVPRPARVEQVDHRLVADLSRAWTVEDGFADAEEGGAGLERAGAHVAARRAGVRVTLAAFDPWPAGFATLRVSPPAGVEIAGLYVAADHRGRGLGAALLDGAVAVARDSVPGGDLWIEADADDWPRRLYASRGFSRVWLQHKFVRRPLPAR